MLCLNAYTWRVVFFILDNLMAAVKFRSPYSVAVWQITCNFEFLLLMYASMLSCFYYEVHFKVHFCTLNFHAIHLFLFFFSCLTLVKDKKHPRQSPGFGPIPDHSKAGIYYWKLQWICHVHLSLREMKMNKGNFLPTIISSLGKHQRSTAFSPYSPQLRGYLSSENEILLLRSSLQKITAGAGPLTCPCRGLWVSVGPVSEI